MERTITRGGVGLHCWESGLESGLPEPVQITGKRGNAVLVGEDDWRAVQETLYLVSIPGMRESIIEGIATPVEECANELDW
jgi:antitoxin YefM